VLRIRSIAAAAAAVERLRKNPTSPALKRSKTWLLRQKEVPTLSGRKRPRRKSLILAKGYCQTTQVNIISKLRKLQTHKYNNTYIYSLLNPAAHSILNPLTPPPPHLLVLPKPVHVLAVYIKPPPFPGPALNPLSLVCVSDRIERFRNPEVAPRFPVDV